MILGNEFSLFQFHTASLWELLLSTPEFHSVWCPAFFPEHFHSSSFSSLLDFHPISVSIRLSFPFRTSSFISVTGLAMEIFGVYTVRQESGGGGCFPSFTYLQAYAKGGETRPYTQQRLCLHTCTPAHAHMQRGTLSRDKGVALLCLARWEASFCDRLSAVDLTSEVENLNVPGIFCYVIMINCHKEKSLNRVSSVQVLFSSSSTWSWVIRSHSSHSFLFFFFFLEFYCVSFINIFNFFLYTPKINC